MARSTFLIPANQRPVESHQLDTAQSTHHEHGPTTPTPAKKTTPTPAKKTTPMPAKKTTPMPAKKTSNGPTRKQLMRSKYMPSSTISTGPSPWTAHRVAVVMLWRHRHLKKLKEKKKAKAKVGGAKKEKDLQNVVLPYEGDGSKRGGPFEAFLRHKYRPRKPSRFFFEHQARASAEASENNTTSGSSSGDRHQ